MGISAFEFLSDEINNHTVTYRLYPVLWDKFDLDINDLVWNEVKYLNDEGILSQAVNEIPPDKGGIYIFYVKSNVLPGLSEYLMYIGRAQLTKNHDLMLRCKKYLSEYTTSKNPRPKVYQMIRFWKDKLYLRYAFVEDNTKIKELEAKLIDTLLPPFNDTIPNKTISAAVKAFSF